MKLHLKHMVSIRDKLLVRAELEKLGLRCINVILGEAEIEEEISGEKFRELSEALKKISIELIIDKKEILVESLKTAIIKLVHFPDASSKLNLSHYLSKKLGYEYAYLSRVFSQSTGNTIENFYILHKIERVKELLMDGEFNITHISLMLGYSSPAHLSNQFKSITGMTPSGFKKMENKERIKLEDI